MVSYADEEGGLASRHREVYDVERDLFNSINARQYEFEQLTTDGRRRTDHRFLVLGVLRDMGQMLTAPGSPLQAPRSRLPAQGSPLKAPRAGRPGPGATHQAARHEVDGRSAHPGVQ